MSDTLWRLLSPEVFAVSTFGLAATLFVVGGGRAALLVAVVGWFLLTPLSAVLRGVAEDDDEATDRATESVEAGARDAETGDPVERLRERYADGELDDVEFERRLEALVATEDADPETAHERLQRDEGVGADTDDLSTLLDDETDDGEREIERE
ncbi:MAG: putative membrane protein (DUF2078) [halophilic archaeon J07HB67]|jgi:Predicted membrane protein (DUF2078).|nr:MAG: putative membrane protein (DUF2078) [halophilic archaeon J07HB67]